MTLPVAGPTTPAAVNAGGLITCRPAVADADLASHRRIRHDVFVTEQAVFDVTDHDSYDDGPAVVHLLGCYDGEPAGAVRLFPLDDRGQLWQGDRLCVLPPYRVHGVGAPLVRCAVATAGALGGSRMVAHIQVPNVVFFTRLGWHADGPEEMYVGLPHQPMSIDLPKAAEGARAAQEFADGIRRR